MRNQQVNIALKEDEYDHIYDAYRKVVARTAGKVPSLSEWARTVLLRSAKRTK